MPDNYLKRRTFLKLIGTGLGSFAFPFQGFPIPNTEIESNINFILGKPYWFLNSDGTFNISAGDISILNCRPSINGQSIFVKNVFMGDSPKGKRIIYEIDGGFVMLDLKTHSNTISIGAEISGFGSAPILFNPLGEGKLKGANRFYRLGLGTGGQSGIFNISDLSSEAPKSYPFEEAWSYESFLMSAIIAKNGDTLAVGAYDQKDFIQKSSIYNRPGRTGLRDKNPGFETVFFEAGFLTENIPLKDDFIKLPELYIYHGNRPYGTIQNLAWGISELNFARKDSHTNYFWTPTQDFKSGFSYNYLLEQLETLDKIKPSVPIQTINVGSGYCIVGDWLDTIETWPKTMEDVARQIFRRKYRAGIYVAPFAVHEKSRLFRIHPRWILKDLKGEMIKMSEDQNGNLYALDGSNDDVKEYLAKVFSTLRKMGFTYYELDFLDWGLKDSSEVQRSKKGKSSVQIFREIMDIIREEAGAGSFITANHAPYGPLIGYVDSVRIDRDHCWKWEENITCKILNESYNTQVFNNIFWQNDPDVVFTRDYKIEFTEVEKKSIALWTGFIGGSIGVSDSFKIMSSEKLQLWRFLEPNKRPQSAILPFWGSETKIKVAVRKYRKNKAWGLLVMNTSESSISDSISMKDIIDQIEAWVFLWEPGFSIGIGKTNKILINLDKHESKLYYISEVNENPTLSLTISGIESTIE